MNPFDEIERRHRRRLRWIAVRYWLMIGAVLFVLAAPILLAYFARFL